MNLKNTPAKREIRKRHDSGYEVKNKNDKKKMNHVFCQTNITFPPTTDFMAQTLDSLITPASKGLENLRNRSKFATLNPAADPPILNDSKRSSQSFKIGLRALNVETWRIKKKNFQ